MSSSANTAAWLVAEKSSPFEVKAASMGKPGDNEILVRNHAVAINPIDPLLQYQAFFPMKYPVILGEDVAGEVVEVGPNVTDFKPGQRVLGNAAGFMTQKPEGCGFQAYTIVATNMATELPDDVSFEQAAVVPLCCSTAASGLFQDEYLKMQLPTEPAQKPIGQTVLIWGGASSVGSNGIQLAVAAGYEVITTASPKNFEYVKKLGATQVFDYNSPSVVEDIVAAFKGKKSAGALDCVGGDSGWAGCTGVVSKTDGNKFVAATKREFPKPPEGVSMKAVFGTTIQNNNVGGAVFRDYLAKALKAKTFVPSPEPLVSGKGLESIQGAVDLYMKGGISAKKIVVSL